MRGLVHSTDKGLPENDLRDLADALAIMLHERMSGRVQLLERRDIAELLERELRDVTADDRRTIIWMVWHLFQEGMED